MAGSLNTHKSTRGGKAEKRQDYALSLIYIISEVLGYLDSDHSVSIHGPQSPIWAG